ncbi:hypothetical protein V8E54_001240 [Elaphomyces granulatus]
MLPTLSGSLLTKQYDTPVPETCSTWTPKNCGKSSKRNNQESVEIDKHHGFLWVKGKPGAGKSILMKSLFSNTKESAKVISFFKDIGEHAVDVNTRLHICFSSRHYPTIIIQRGHEVALEGEEEHAADITRYTKAGRGSKIRYSGEICRISEW